jgi:hypothetical protein
MTDKSSASPATNCAPSAIYVWLVPSEEVLEQPGSWRIRKWDTAPFPEANYTLSETLPKLENLQDAPRTLRNVFTIQHDGKRADVVYASFASCIEREANSLRHDMERGMANHNADLNGTTVSAIRQKIDYTNDPLTPAGHKQRHVELHKAVDELFADYIRHHPSQHSFLEMPLKDFIEWSHSQTIIPTEGE